MILWQLLKNWRLDPGVCKCILTLKKSCSQMAQSKRNVSTKTNILSPTTLREYKSAQKNAYKDISEIPLCQLDSIVVQKWINQYSEKHAPKTVRNAYGLLSAAVNFYHPSFRYLTILCYEIRRDLCIGIKRH